MKLIPNTLHYGDCLEVMRQWPDGCVDLIYLDPPFNSNANYNILFGKEKRSPSQNNVSKRKDLAQLVAFTDMWEWSERTARRIEEISKATAHPARDAVLALDILYKNSGGMLTYLVYMADRIAEMRRILKPAGSIYLHCDPTASHYLKIVMDAVFGMQSYRNEITWCYRGMGNKSAAKFQARHDVILMYAGNASTFNHQFGEPTPESQKTYESAARVGYLANHSRMLVTVFDREKYGAAVKAGKLPRGMKEMEFDGGKPLISDWWADIKILGGPKNKERLGYPTQKPLALLERIISASSNQGDIVLDPFCGCGTTIEAAMNLNRQFIGIDISMYALNVIQKQRLKDARFKIDGIPADMQSARAMAEANPFAFEKWAVHLIPGFVANNKQRGDGGVDGWGCLLHAPENEEGICMAQVKGGTPSADALRAFTSRLAGGSASLGVFITLEKCDTPTARQCIADAGTFKLGANQYNRMLMWSIEEYFAGAMPPLPPLANPVTGKAIQEDIMTRG